MSRTGTFMFAVGFLVTAFGVGGVEQSLTDGAMIQAFLVSLVGCAIMGVGVSLLNSSEV